MRDMPPGRDAPDRVEELLTAAGKFFEDYLWSSESSRAARGALTDEGLEENVLRGFGIGYAPIGHTELKDHFLGLGYSDDELVAAGLLTRSARGRVHTHFRSRVMFPVKDRDGRVLGFAGQGTHLGPSWALWVTSPDVGLYRRSEAVFGLDRAAERIVATGTALVLPDCIEVLRAHQAGRTNAVTVHTNRITRNQRGALGAGVAGGVDGLELDLPEGMRVESEDETAALKPAPARPETGSGSAELRPRHLLKRLALVVATAVAATNVWTGAPLLAVWVGSQVQSGRLLSMRGVVTVVVVLGVLTFLLGWLLTWLSARYDKLTGRPPTAGQTSPW